MPDKKQRYNTRSLRSFKCSYLLRVRIVPFHGADTSSNLVGSTIHKASKHTRRCTALVMRRTQFESVRGLFKCCVGHFVSRVRRCLVMPVIGVRVSVCLPQHIVSSSNGLGHFTTDEEISVRITLRLHIAASSKGRIKHFECFDGCSNQPAATFFMISLLLSYLLVILVKRPYHGTNKLRCLD